MVEEADLVDMSIDNELHRQKILQSVDEQPAMEPFGEITMRVYRPREAERRAYWSRARGGLVVVAGGHPTRGQTPPHARIKREAQILFFSQLEILYSRSTESTKEGNFSDITLTEKKTFVAVSDNKLYASVAEWLCSQKHFAQQLLNLKKKNFLSFAQHDILFPGAQKYKRPRSQCVSTWPFICDNKK